MNDCQDCGRPNKRGGRFCSNCYQCRYRQNPEVRATHRRRVIAYQKANPEKRRVWVHGSPASAGGTRTSKPSAPPTNGSSKLWRKPRDAKGFAAQANEVATMILNGEIDLDQARTYSGVARTMAQVLSAEVYRARFLQQAPDLTFEEETHEPR